MKGMNAVRLYTEHTKQELVAMMKLVEEDPKNLEPPESTSLFKLNDKGRKKTADIARAIAFHLEDEREKQGRPVPVAGYSGRKSN